MIAIAAAALLAAAQGAEPAPANDPQATFAAAKAMYDQSCQVRAYGSYDDLCGLLRQQMRDAAREQEKAAKRKSVAAPVVETKPAAPSPPPAPAVVSTN